MILICKHRTNTMTQWCEHFKAYCCEYKLGDMEECEQFVEVFPDVKENP
jgi:hypothetical protein